MKLSDLRGKAVVGLARAHKLGTVGDAFAGADYQQIQALQIRPEGGGPDYVVAVDHVRAIGPDAVTVDSQDSLQRVDQATDLTRLPSLGSLLGAHVVTEAGDVLGAISGIEIDPETRQVTGFQYQTSALGGLLGRHYTLKPRDIIGVSARLVTVKDVARPSRAA